MEPEHQEDCFEEKMIIGDNLKEIKIVYQSSEVYFSKCLQVKLQDFKIIEKKKTSDNPKSPLIYTLGFKWNNPLYQQIKNFFEQIKL